MISVSGKKWIEQKVNKNLVEKVQQDYNFNSIVSKLIVSKNYDSDEINNINNKLKLVNVFNNNIDFDEATNILINSINKNEKICVLGDYDVDGASATSLLVRYFKHINQKHFYYIPDRESDGYGATTKLFQKLLLKKPKLVLLVDCGSTSNEAIDYLNKNKVKSIIIDHHEINTPYPKSNIIINPKKKTEYNKYDYLCATTLTYFFIDILIKKTKSNFNLSKFLIYVLLATVCDVMPLRKLNKILASNIFKNFQVNNNLAFNTIFNQLKLKRKLTIEDLGFIIGPLINAGGRLGYSNLGTLLLTSDSEKEVKRISLKLIQLNEKRKKIEKFFLNKIDFIKIKNENKDVIIYYDNNLHEGLIGIIAARLKEFFNKPSIVITRTRNILKASARSTPNYNIGNLVKLLIDKKIIESGGGHNLAAGFSIKKENIKLLDIFIQNDYQKKNKLYKSIFNYDFEISSSAININLFNIINKLGPFGNDNFLPTFLIRDVKIIKSNEINKNHISAILKPKSGPSLKTICFNCYKSEVGNHLLSYKKKINIIAEVTKNSWNNKNIIQLNIKDLIIPVNTA
tara:strand:+ start:422 stop:2131 length:1710 start_codon:yes stop_codon:yes gene_type:complete